MIEKFLNIGLLPIHTSMYEKKRKEQKEAVLYSSNTRNHSKVSVLDAFLWSHSLFLTLMPSDSQQVLRKSMGGRKRLREANREERIE